MKKYYNFILFMAIALGSSAQVPLNAQHYIDSLVQSLKKPISDGAKAKNSFMISEYFIELDSVKSKQYLQLGHKYTKNDKYMQAVYLFFSAGSISKSHPDLAMKMYLKAEQALKPYKTPDALRARARCWHDYARLLQIANDDAGSYVDILLNKAIPLAEQSGDRGYLGKYYLDISFAFKNLNDFKKAQAYQFKAIQTLKSAPKASHFLASAYQTLSENYTLSGKAKEAAAVLDSMKALLKPYPESDAWLDYYAAEGMRLTVAGQFEQSLSIINKGIEMAQKLKQDYPEQRLLMQKFYALYNKKDFLQAKEVALNLSHRKLFMILASNRAQLFYCLALTNEDLKNKAEAYDWMKRYSALSDSISQSTLQTKLNTLDVKYQTAQKQKKIAELEVDRQKATLTNWLLGIASIALLVVVVSLIFYFRNNKKLAQQKELNYQQQLKEKDQLQKLSFAEALLTGEERERQRVARDLHDGLGGMLSGIKIKLSGQARADGNHGLDSVILQLDHSVTELRRIARNMMPESLLKLGLETALLDLCELLMSDQTQISFQAYDIRKDMPAIIQANIYRIVQETLTNAVRHAQASKIILQCSQNGDIFMITVEDNGKGFDAEAALKAGGIGFSNIKSRVDYLKGKIDIESAVNEGTSINIELDVSG